MKADEETAVALLIGNFTQAFYTFIWLFIWSFAFKLLTLWSNDHVFIPIVMVYNDKIYIALDSMGVALDFQMENEASDINFTPSVGSVVYNPVTHTIDTYMALNGDSWDISSRSVNGNDLYLNLRTGRAYIWNGSEMQHTHTWPRMS